MKTAGSPLPGGSELFPLQARERTLEDNDKESLRAIQRFSVCCAETLKPFSPHGAKKIV
jgi:hypothetical protein